MTRTVPTRDAAADDGNTMRTATIELSREIPDDAERYLLGSRTALAWLIDRHQIPAEEKALEERFGQDYLDYKEAVPRWLGAPSVRGRCRAH